MKRNGKIIARVILYPFSPIVLILCSLALGINTFFVLPLQSVVGLLFMLTGIPEYFYYKKTKKVPAKEATYFE